MLVLKARAEQLPEVLAVALCELASPMELDDEGVVWQDFHHGAGTVPPLGSAALLVLNLHHIIDLDRRELAGLAGESGDEILFPAMHLVEPLVHVATLA